MNQRKTVFYEIQNIKNPICSQVHGVVASDVQWFI